MDFANFDVFWKALGRLYEDTLRVNEALDKLRAGSVELRDSMKDLRDATGNLLRAVEKHQTVLESHERRLDRTEITVEAILEDLRRHRQGPSPQ